MVSALDLIIALAKGKNLQCTFLSYTELPTDSDNDRIDKYLDISASKGRRLSTIEIFRNC